MGIWSDAVRGILMEQVLQLTNIIAPLIIDFVRAHYAVNGEAPTVEQVHAYIASKSDEVVSEMKRRYPLPEPGPDGHP